MDDSLSRDCRRRPSVPIGASPTAPCPGRSPRSVGEERGNGCVGAAVGPRRLGPGERSRFGRTGSPGLWRVCPGTWGQGRERGRPGRLLRARHPRHSGPENDCGRSSSLGLRGSASLVILFRLIVARASVAPLWLKAPAAEEGTGILHRVYRSATTCLKCRIGPGYYVVLFRFLQMDFAEFYFYALR